MIDVAGAAVAAEVAQNNGIHIDTSINLTLIVGVIVWIVTIAIAWSKFGGRQDLFDQRLDMQNDALKEIGRALKTLSENDKDIALLKQSNAAQEMQIAQMARDIADLRRGNGFIRKTVRDAVDGEY